MNMNDDTYPTPPRLDLTNKRIVIMQRGGHERPLAVHDSLDGAMEDIGKRAAAHLLDGYDTAHNALYLITVDR
jgi:hypothetical protein